MSKVHFIYFDINTSYFHGVHHGLAQLISVIKDNGHDVSLHHIKQEIKQEELLNRINIENPGYVGITLIENQLKYARQWSLLIKQKTDIPIIGGGVYATLNPKEVLEFTDMVCIGEGEYPLVDLLNSKKQIDNIWLKDGQKPGLRRLVVDLDMLPIPDYDLFDIKQMLIKTNGRFAVIVSRGCPFDCNNCSNYALKEVQKGLGQYFRFRSVSNTIEMLKYYQLRYSGIKHFSFADDIFGINKNWVYEFCEKYPQKIGLPFDCNLRVEMADLDILKALKNAGCVEVEMGVESGNEKIRAEILNRKMSNQKIISVFDNAHKLGIKTRAYNMIGLPHETSSMIKDTIELNKRIKPDDVAVFYFYPFKGTKLYNVCRNEDLLTHKEITNYVTDSILELPTITKKELYRLYNVFYRFVINQKLKSYSTIKRIIAQLVFIFLRIFTLGNEIKIIRGIYQWLRF